MCLAVVVVLGLPQAFAQDTGPGDTGGPVDTGTDPALDLDLDGDGWTPRQGDCDDAEPLARPGTDEVCEDRIDNDCDGLYDEGCDYRARLASLRGGGGCTGGAAPASAAMLLPLLGLALGRRRGQR